MIKNINKSQVIDFAGLVEYAEGQIVSRTLSQNRHVSLTLFAFDKGEEISSHKSKGDALVLVLDGKTKITVGEQQYFLTQGQSIVMPAGVPHALEAEEPFKMLLTVIFPAA